MELANDTIVTVIMLTGVTESNWDKPLPFVELTMNTAVNRTTGYALFQLPYGYVPILTNGWVAGVFDRNTDLALSANWRQEARAHIQQAQMK